MSKFVFAILVIAAQFMAAGHVFSQNPGAGSAQTNPAQGQVVGVVTAIDNGRVTVKNAAGESIVVITSDSSALLRLPPGETSAQKAAKITLTEIAAGDRLFARGTVSADGKSIEARQVVVTGATAATDVAQDQQRQREDFRQRGLMGRIISLNPDKKEISVQSRWREAAQGVTISVSDATRIFRYAPDSMNIKDASRSSFAQLRVGDQLRALGNRNTDGTQFTAEEIIAGTMTRTGGQVVAVDPSRNEVTIKDRQGQTVTVAVGERSSLRRVTPEAAASFETRTTRRGQGARDGGQARQGDQEGRPRERRERDTTTNAEGERRQRGGRGGFQQMLENLPAITVNDLKKGDTIFVTGSEGTDASRVTAIMLVTGDPAFMNRLLQPGQNRGPQSPGLPGDVMGGGVGPGERPTSP